MLTSEFIEKMKQLLLAKKQQLLEELAGLSAHTELGMDEEDTAAELPLDEMNQDLISHIKDDLQKIERALLKIQDGTYGVDDAGNEFSEKQLEANPYAEVALDVE
jgi:RNA polymerase-binding transcription factor DksA